MSQLQFKTRAAYIEWRSHWRAKYRALTEVIRENKKVARSPTNVQTTARAAQSAATLLGQDARTMLMAREASKAHYTAMRYSESGMLPGGRVEPNTDVALDASSVVGLPVSEAAEALRYKGIFCVRVTREDGRYGLISADYRLDRLNVVVDDGIITEVRGIG